MTASALYEGWVHHRRHTPATHDFRYRVFMTLLDLDELPGLFDRHPMWSARRPAPMWFRRTDHFGEVDEPLADAARRLVAERTGHHPDGPVRLLTHLRCLGRVFNPVSFFYVHDGTSLDAVIAEVTNTPWGDRHVYVVPRAAPGAALGGVVPKQLHVSPFMPMEQAYDWRVTEPGESLRVRIATLQSGREVFAASLVLRRRELTAASMTRVLLTYPPMSLAVPARIYSQAARLALKRIPRHARVSR
jgi:uncharacterized protein